MHFTFLKYPILNFKRYFEQIIMFPFVYWGKIFSSTYIENLDLKQPFDIVFFYPNAGVGGAERTNADILNTIPELNKLVIYTKKGDYSLNQNQMNSPNTQYVILGEVLDVKKKYWRNLIWRGVLSKWINTSSNASQVFIGQCNFGYKILPHLNKKKIKVSELIHMLDAKFANVWIPFISFIDRRVVISKVIKKQFEDYYRKKNIPKKYQNRIVVIPNKIPFDIPPYQFNYQKPLKIVYAGRGGPQKRIWLLNQIIEKTAGMDVEYHLAGDFHDELMNPLPPNVTYYGKINADEMPSFYQGKHVLLMTSAWEGFPFAIMESMIYGIIPVITEVDSIPEHISHTKNGFLLVDPVNEEKVIQQGCDVLSELLNDPNLAKNVSKNAYEYIAQNFQAEKFNLAYRHLFIEK